MAMFQDDKFNRNTVNALKLLHDNGEQLRSSDIKLSY